MNVYAYRRNAQAFHTPNQSCIRIYNGVFEFWCEKRVTVLEKEWDRIRAYKLFQIFFFFF